ncbi:MAG: hypothetical protein AB8B73_01265 [Ekhidna sp.]
MKLIKSLFSLLITLGLVFTTSCSEDDDHDHDHDGEEVINQVVVTFTPTSGGASVSATWFDADGEGTANPTIGTIDLAANTEYDMAMTLANTLGAEDEDVTEEIEGEGDEHMFFFEFTTDIFSNPAGNGNSDNRADPLNYGDNDENGFPVGLESTWTTGDVTSAAGNFRVILKHQPDGLKTADSNSSVGGTDVNITFPININ